MKHSGGTIPQTKPISNGSRCSFACRSMKTIRLIANNAIWRLVGANGLGRGISSSGEGGEGEVDCFSSQISFGSDISAIRFDKVESVRRWFLFKAGSGAQVQRKRVEVGYWVRIMR